MTIDLKKRLRHLYQPPAGDFTEVDVPEIAYLAIDGHGDPNTAPAYPMAVESLYTAAYSIRAALKARTGQVFTVGPLEGLWSSANPTDFVTGTKSSWDWTMMIALPDEVTAGDVTAGLQTATRKKPQLPVDRIRRVVLTEGQCLQILHVGSYDDEAPTLARLHHQVMPERGVTWNGRHHEIYLGDPRRTPPDKLKTVLRQPVTAAPSSSPAGRSAT